jgi:nicotinate-nucleotide adenylyltransferase
VNLALFGGTFDPIHRGHLAAARAAAARFSLKQVLFIPAAVPPHKPGMQITAFEHRYAMVALATARDKRFVPSLLEAPRPTNVLQFRAKGEPSHGPPNYSITTVRHIKSTLRGKDKLFFIVGVDAFIHIAEWHQPESLLEEVGFIIVSRPGFSMAEVAGALPESLRPADPVLRPFTRQKPRGSLVLPGVTLHLLDTVKENVSATTIRSAAQRGRSLARFVAPEVADYIRKERLYRD